MAKTIIKKKTTKSGTIELSYCRKDEGYTRTISFGSETQLKAFAILLDQMVLFDAGFAEVK